jgi:hypothetical protein
MSAPDVPTDYQIRLELFGFERGFLESYLDNALDMIRRSHPTVQFQSHSMQSFHRIIQFTAPSTSVTSEAAAFDFFHFTIRLMQSVNPPELFFTAEFPQGKTFFPGSRQILSPHQPSDVEHTILNLNTSNGKLSTPPAKYSQEDAIVVHKFSLNLLKENLSFAVSPFVEWRQVESRYGCLTFPPMPNTNLAPPPDFQQPAPENYQKYSNVNGKMRKEKAFVVPPPNSRLGSWSVQQSQDWEMASFDQIGPDLHNPPFERRHYQRLQPQSIAPPSRFDYLDSFRNQKHWGNWGRNRKDTQELVESAPPLPPTSSASANLVPENSTAQAQITNLSLVENQTTNAQIHEPPASNADNLHTPLIKRPDKTLRRRRSPVDDRGHTPPLSSSQLKAAEPTLPIGTQASPAADTSASVLDHDTFFEIPSTPPGSGRTVIIDSEERSRVRNLPPTASSSTAVTQSVKTARVSSHEESSGATTRSQSKLGPDKQDESNLLANWLESAKVKQVYKEGDGMPAFLESYSDKLLQRANMHEPPDSIAQCLTPFLFLRDGHYVLDKSAVTCQNLNLLDALYEFEKTSNSAPTKLAHWFNQKLRGPKL